MKQGRLAGTLCGVALCFFSAAVPVGADITSSTSNWESPVNNQEVSGIQITRGWVYSTTGAPVTVTLRVVSPGTAAFVVPWGSARSDVGPNPPQLNSGFGFTINIDLLPPGPATLELEFREGTGSGPCNPPACLTVTRNVTVAKPGGRAGESSQLFSFLNDLNPTGANVALDSATEELIVTPVTVQDSGAGGTRRSTIRLRWLENSQSFGIVQAASDRRFAGVQVIFTAKCASCHTGGGSVLPASMNLSNADSSFQNLVAVKSAEASSLFRINPGDDEASYLYQKVIPDPTIAIQGERMPLGCAGNSCLSQGEINTIENWINGGAAPPQ